MITLIKLGGSLITDKNRPRLFRQAVMQRLATDISIIAQCSSSQQYIIGHGSGSFGHVTAEEYDTIHGVTNEEQWLGFTKVAHVASELSQLVTHELIQAKLPVFRIQPSASSLTKNGIVTSMYISQIERALIHKLIPLIHGDVAFDSQLGGTITSTEAIFTYLVNHLDINRIILLGEVDGVLDQTQQVIPKITSDTFHVIKDVLGGSEGIDVTGGMYQKVVDMLKLVELRPSLQILIANGNVPNVLVDLICGNKMIGTCITAED